MRVTSSVDENKVMHVKYDDGDEENLDMKDKNVSFKIVSTLVEHDVLERCGALCGVTCGRISSCCICC